MFTLDLLIWGWITSKFAFLTGGSMASLFFITKVAIVTYVGATAYEIATGKEPQKQTKKKK